MNIEIEELNPELALELDGMLHAHNDETNPMGVDLNPNWPEYAESQKLGAFMAFIARKDGAIIGYAGFFIRKHLHHSHVSCAFQDVLYVHPDHRGGQKGMEIIRYYEGVLKEMGIEFIFQHAHPGSVLDDVLPKIGYLHHENVYSRRLNHG